MSNITIKTKRVKFSMDETPPEQFLNSPYPYDCIGDSSDFNNNVYLGNYENSSTDSNWQNIQCDNITGLGNPVDYYNSNVMNYGNPAPNNCMGLSGSGTDDANNNIVSSSNINNSYGSNYNSSLVNNTYTPGYYSSYVGGHSNYTTSSSAALSSFTVPNNVVNPAPTGDITNPTDGGAAPAAAGGSQPEKHNEDFKKPRVNNLANSIILQPRIARPGDGTPTGLVPAREPGGKDTKIAIATDSVLAPAKHHIAKIFNKHGVTCSFSPNLEKLTEITGNVAYLFCLYKEYCRKRRCKTVNRETYGRLFRNEFKRKVGSR